jgi:anti-sigma regulatory factor (Ser/Thr protein kinase)
MDGVEAKALAGRASGATFPRYPEAGPGGRRLTRRLAVAAAGGGDTDGQGVSRPRTGDAEVASEAFDAMPTPMAAVQGPRHTIAAANAACRAFARREDLVGLPAWQLFPALLRQRVADLFDLVYAAGEPFTARDWPAGEGRSIDFTLTPWHNRDGGIRGVLVTQAEAEQSPEQRAGEPSADEQSPLRAAQSRTWREAVVVQEAVLPSALPVLPQARVAARYLPAAADDVAGGDWFDAFMLPDRRLALAAGEVADRGTAASAAMGRLRGWLRHALTAGPDLTAALGQVDRFAAGDDALTAATLCVAVLSTADGELQYVTCGHPPPLLAAADGTARFLPGTGGRPLAVGNDALASGSPLSPALGSAVLGSSEVLLLYTDGLVKRAGRTLGDGLADLALVAGDAVANRALAAWGPGSPAERASQLTVELLTGAGYSDDMTTVAVWRQPAPSAPLDVELPASMETVVTLRRAFSDWLEALDVALGDRQFAELAVAEVVGNAVEHAYPSGTSGPVRLEAGLTADGYLRTRVSDHGRWRGPEGTRADRGQGLSVAAQFTEELRITQLAGEAGRPGAQGTVVAMRHRLHRQPMLAPQAVRTVGARVTPAPFAVEVTGPAPLPRVRVSGPVDLATADRLASGLLAACHAGVLPLTVDLSAVTVLAGAGVRALYRTAAQLAAHGHKLALVTELGSPAEAALDLARLPWSAR